MHGGLKARVLKDNLNLAARWLIIKKYEDNLKFKITKMELLHASLLLPHYSICFQWFTMTQEPKMSPVTGKPAVIEKNLFHMLLHMLHTLIFQILCQSYLKIWGKKIVSSKNPGIDKHNFYCFLHCSFQGCVCYHVWKYHLRSTGYLKAFQKAPWNGMFHSTKETNVKGTSLAQRSQMKPQGTTI